MLPHFSRQAGGLGSVLDDHVHYRYGLGELGESAKRERLTPPEAQAKDELLATSHAELIPHDSP